MPRNAWKDKFFVQLYECSKQGLTKIQAARVLGVDYRTLQDWIKNRPAVRESWVLGRGSKVGSTVSNRRTRAVAGAGFLDYVYGRLPPKARRVWDQIHEWEQEENHEKRIEKLVANQGTRTRQYLWVHAFMNSNFNRSEACRRLFIPVATVDNWISCSPGFAQMFDVIKEAKGDFIESALFRLIADGDSAAIIFASKTLNRTRGYDTKVTVQHEGGTVHLGVTVDAVLDDLPVDARKQFLAAIRERANAPKELPPRRVEAEDA